MPSKKHPFTILFICTGNIYRSRLAQAYLISKELPNLKVLSSGTQATIQHKGPITWYALRLLYRHNLLPFMAPSWTQFSPFQLNKADITIFIGKNNFELCQKWLSDSAKCEVWDFPDFEDKDLNGKPLDIKRETEGILVSEKVFSLITKSVDKLIKTCKLDTLKS